MLTEQVICPVCQASTASGQNCWLCRSELTAATLPESDTANSDTANSDHREPALVVATLVNPYAAPIALEETERASFPIIVMIIGLVVVIAALAFVAPGLAILIGVLVAPAMIRTAILVGRKRKDGIDVSAGEKSLIFFASAAGVVAACAGAVSAFGIACTASCLGLLAANSAGAGRSADQAIPVFLFGSVVVGLAAGAIVLRLLWRRK
tara:strand:- start:172323 stop:172949 length:627 start_codon:yes stop_codon:yes gene_type:complete